MAEKLKHVVSAKQFSRGDLEELFPLMERMQGILGRSSLSGELEGTLGYLDFFGPSERTVRSFVSAIHHLKGQFLLQQLPEQTGWSARTHVIDPEEIANEGYDYIVLRGNQVGATERAAEVSPIPLIHAGEVFQGIRGILEHPTQGLGDLHVIKQEVGELDEQRVVFMGDCRNNSPANSLAILLSCFGVSIDFVVPPNLGTINPINQGLFDCLTERATRFKVTKLTDVQDHMTEFLQDLNVLYLTDSMYNDGWEQAIKHVRPGEKPIENQQTLIKRVLEGLPPTNVIIMHDLLRGHKPDFEDYRLRVNEQMRSATAARMAILTQLVDPRY